MAALTADRAVTMEVGSVRSYPVAASSTIYAGAIVCVDNNGYAVPGSDSANLKFVGIAREKADNGSGSAGDISVEVDCIHGSAWRFAATGLAQADGDGTQVYVSDDQTVAKSTTNSVKIGRLAYFESATVAVVAIEPLV
jgi:hypothetical protein